MIETCEYKGIDAVSRAVDMPFVDDSIMGFKKPAHCCTFVLVKPRSVPDVGVDLPGLVQRAKDLLSNGDRSWFHALIVAMLHDIWFTAESGKNRLSLF